MDTIFFSSYRYLRAISENILFRYKSFFFRLTILLEARNSYFQFWATFELVILTHSKQSGLTIWVEMNYVTLTWAKKTNYCGSVDKEASSIKLWRLGSFQIRQSKGPFPLLICTWFLKNQVVKIKFDKLDF